MNRLEVAAQQTDAILLITADHGNADEMYMRKKGRLLVDEQGDPRPRTSHTLNPVPFIVVDPRGERRLRAVPDAGLASVGTTILELSRAAGPQRLAPGPGQLEGLAAPYGQAVRTP